MADMVDCGDSYFDSWHKRCGHTTRYLGQFDPSMPASEAIRLLDFEKIPTEAQQRFTRGWDRAKAAYTLAQGDLYA